MARLSACSGRVRQWYRYTNRPITFAGKNSVTVPAGQSVWSDSVALPFVKKGNELRGRKLAAVSFHVPGTSGPMTWHAKAMQSCRVQKFVTPHETYS